MDDAALTRLICAALGGLPAVHWRPDGPAYSQNEVGVYYGALAPHPDRAFGVRVYGGTGPAPAGVHVRRVQIRIRGARDRPDGADLLAEVSVLVLSSLTAHPGISGITRTSFGPLGADSNGREERTENYTIILNNKEAQL